MNENTINENTVEDKIDSDIKDKYKDSTMTKAGKLAMELSLERKRLREELAQLQSEVDDLSPTTPVGTVDWYIKWVAVISAVLGIFLQSAGLTPWGQVCYLFGSLSWTVVGAIWNDKAVMLGSIIPATATALFLVQHLMEIL